MPSRKKSCGTLDKHNGPRPGESMQEWMRRDIKSMQLKAERHPLPTHVDDRQPSPCYYQTKEGIEEWLRANVKMGTKVAVRETQGNTLSYTIATVDYISKDKRRFGVGIFGAFYYSGKKYAQPTGQTRLVIPTNTVREFIQRHPQGAFSLGKDGYRISFY